MRVKMSKIVNGKRYSTEPSTLIASNEFWDGSNYERSGTNRHLYRWWTRNPHPWGVGGYLPPIFCGLTR